MAEEKFSWVETHQQIADYLSTQENNQADLIRLLKSVGIGPFNDRTSREGGHDTELDEIDPFTFFSFIYKYRSPKRLAYLQKIAGKLNLPIPTGESGIPSAQPQKVWMFPYKFNRTHDEVARLWSLFHKARTGSLSDPDFQDALQIQSTGKAKLTEALFYISPERYFPLDGPTKPYLREVLGLNPEFKTYTEYAALLEQIRNKTNLPFYQISAEAWEWNKQKTCNYWIFQGNPAIFDAETALRNNQLTSWSVRAHKENIKVGDKVILWITGDKAGCYALAEVTSEPQLNHPSADGNLWNQPDTGALKAGIHITHNLADRPILYKDIADNEELAGLKVGSQGTNFSATEGQFEALLQIIQQTNGPRYWLYTPGQSARMWEEFYRSGIMAIGWDEIGDLKQYQTRQQIKEALERAYGGQGSKKNILSANHDFYRRINVGDVIIAKNVKGTDELLGYGVVTSDYAYDPSRSSYQKIRKVDWKLKGSWKTGFELVPKTLTDITKNKSDKPGYHWYYEELLDLMNPENTMNNPDAPTPSARAEVSFPLNTILYGPPGTGKTYHTVLRAAEIVANRKIDSYQEALRIYKAHLHNQIEFITFHQNYSYEDFIQGLRPQYGK